MGGAGVVHVQPQPVTGAMHVEALVGLSFERLVERTGEEPQVEQPLSEYAHRGLMGVVEGGAGADRGDRRFLRREHEVVEQALRRTEAPVDGEGAGDVGSVAVVFTACVDEHQFACLSPRAVVGVMQDAGVGAAGDEGRVGRALGAVAAEFGDELRFQRVFVHAGATDAHCAAVGMGGDRRAALHQLELEGVLDAAHAGDERAGVVQRGRGRRTEPGLGAQIR